MRFLLFKQITFKLGNCTAVNSLSRSLRLSGKGGEGCYLLSERKIEPDLRLGKGGLNREGGGRI